jgi:NhaP-type Na+/H+ or K+/H+ antiporter
MVPSGRPYGLWRDCIRDAAQSRTSQILWDTSALVSFQVPIYAAILAVSGADLDEVLRGSLEVIIIMLVLGRPYGAYLGFIRRRFGLCSDSQKTMSLDVD